VEECSKEIVFAKIEQAHTCVLRSAISDSILPIYSELRYLFHFNEDVDQLKPWVRVPTETRELRNCLRLWYFPSDNPYSLYQLLPESDRADSPFAFVRKSFLELDPSTVQVRGLDWKTWLESLTGACTFPRLFRQDGSKCYLTAAMSAVIKHDPAKFLGTLKARWGIYRRGAAKVEQSIRNIDVDCMSGRRSPLQSTYLPTSAVLSEISKLTVRTIDFPLIRLSDDALDDADTEGWRFLEMFGVRSKVDRGFYKTALRVLKDIGRLVSLETATAHVYKSMAGLATVSEYEDLRYV
jgi:hypothetical protein